MRPRRVSTGGSGGTKVFAPTAAFIYAWSQDSERLFFSQVALDDKRPKDPHVRLGRFVYTLSTAQTQEIGDFMHIKHEVPPDTTISPNGNLAISTWPTGPGPEEPIVEWRLSRVGAKEAEGSVIHIVPSFNAFPKWLDDKYLVYKLSHDSVSFFDVENSQVSRFRLGAASDTVKASAIWPKVEKPIPDELAAAGAAQKKPIESKLGLIRSALSRYYGIHEGKYPTSIRDLVPRFLKEIPTLDLVQHGPTDGVIEVKQDAGPDLHKHLQDSGRLLYIADPKSPIFGTIVIDCHHRPSYGMKWHSR